MYIYIYITFHTYTMNFDYIFENANYKLFKGIIYEHMEFEDKVLISLDTPKEGGCS